MSGLDGVPSVEGAAEALRRGQVAAAEAALAKIVGADSANAEAWHLRALAAALGGRPTMARECFKKAVAAHPEEASWLCNYAQFLYNTRDFERAEDVARRALAAQPEAPAALNVLGCVAAQGRRLEEAERLFLRALAPGVAATYSNLAGVYRLQLRVGEAQRAAERALELDPEWHEARMHLAEALLISGQWERGWAAYEARWHMPGAGAKRHQRVPAWTGGELKGRTLLLWAEQGMGDTIQFARYGELLADRGARVVLECHEPLKSLMVRCPYFWAVRSEGEALPAADVQLAIADAPRVCGTRYDAVPAKVPYLYADARAVRRWRERLAGERGMKVGLVWSGNPRQQRNVERSMPLAALAPLGAVEGVSYYSLQVGPAGREPVPAGLRLIDHTGRLSSMDETAGLIGALDLVITVDTAVAHLAGALNRPVWTFVMHMPDWRWRLGIRESPWYPSMRLFRQRARWEWGPVVEEVAGELRRVVEEAPAAAEQGRQREGKLEG